MNQKNEEASRETRLGIYISWGIVIGAMIGVFAGIFWFEMGLSMIFGTAAGLIAGTAIGLFVDKNISPS